MTKQIDALPLARLDAEACKALRAAVSADENRPILHHVLLRDGIAEATSGHVLVRIPMTGPGGEEFALPDECRDNRFLLPGAALAHVKGGTALEVEMRTGEVRVVAATGEKEGYPIELPDAQIETEGMRYPNTDAVLPTPDETYRTVRLGAPVIRAMLAFAGGSGKFPGSLTMMVPDEAEGGHVQTALTFRRNGESPRTGLVMPMRVTDDGPDAPQPIREREDAPADPRQTSAFDGEDPFPDPDGAGPAAGVED